VLVTRLDRFACFRRDLDVPAALTNRGAAFRSLSAARADTAPHGRGVLAVLAGLAEFERELIRAGRSEGRARTKANGVRMSWPPKLAHHRR
jgi:DNA invertase Pin-like site-specific DNA recombinase